MRMGAIIMNGIECSTLCLDMLHGSVYAKTRCGGGVGVGKSIPNSSKMPVQVNTAVPQAMTAPRAIITASAGRDTAPKATARICLSVAVSPHDRTLTIHVALFYRFFKQWLFSTSLCLIVVRGRFLNSCHQPCHHNHGNEHKGRGLFCLTMQDM